MHYNLFTDMYSINTVILTLVISFKKQDKETETSSRAKLLFAATFETEVSPRISFQHELEQECTCVRDTYTQG